jgi:hypothetical protein
MTHIIEKLRNDEHYYGSLGKAFLSNSDIDTLLNNPKDFGRSRDDSKSFAEGRLFHQLLIEPEKAAKIQSVSASTRNTNIYKAFCEERNLEFALLDKEVEDIKSLTSIMKGNISFFEEIYREGNLYEEPMIGDIKGMTWKGKSDIITHDKIIDLKTTSDIKKFKWSAKAYNYDSQCYIYQMLFNKPLEFYVIDKTTGQLGIFRPTTDFVRNGELKVEKAIQVYNKYFGPEHTDDIANYYIDETLE